MTTFAPHLSPDHVVALAQVQAVVHRYAYLARNGLKWEEISQTLQADAQFHLANGMTLSTSQWQNILQGDQAEYIRHHITTVDVGFESETRATAMVQFFALTHASACDHWGEWQMVVLRDSDGKWLISEMKIVLDGVDPKGWAAAKYKHA